MILSQLPDGSWTTSPTYVGVGLKTPCAEREHHWETVGDKTPLPEASAGVFSGVTHTSFQVCKKCGYQRVLLTKEHPA